MHWAQTPPNVLGLIVPLVRFTKTWNNFSQSFRLSKTDSLISVLHCLTEMYCDFLPITSSSLYPVHLAWMFLAVSPSDWWGIEWDISKCYTVKLSAVGCLPEHFSFIHPTVWFPNVFAVFLHALCNPKHWTDGRGVCNRESLVKNARKNEIIIFAHPHLYSRG